MTQPLDAFTSSTLEAIHLAAEAKSEQEALERLKLQFASDDEIGVLKNVARGVFGENLSDKPTIKELHELRIRCLAEEKRGEGSWFHRLIRSSQTKAEDKARAKSVSDAILAFSSMGTHENFIKYAPIKEDLIQLVEKIKAELGEKSRDLKKNKPSYNLYEWFKKDPSQVNRDFVDQEYVLQIRHLVREQGIELTPEELALLDRAENNRPTIIDLSKERIENILGFYESAVGNEALKRLSTDLKRIFVPPKRSLMSRVGSVFRGVHSRPSALVQDFNKNRLDYLREAEVRIARQEGRLNDLQTPKNKANQIRAHVKDFKDLHVEDESALRNHPLSKLNLDDEDEHLLQSFREIVPELLKDFKSEVSQETWLKWLEVDGRGLKEIDWKINDAFERFLREPNEHLALLQLSKDISAIIPGEGGADGMTAVAERALFLLRDNPEVLERLMTFYIPESQDYQHENSMVRRLIEQLFFREFASESV